MIVDCDFCHQPLEFENSGFDQAPVMVLGPGLIYYPTKSIGSYNGAEVHMQCAVNMQVHMVSERIVVFVN